MNTGVEKVKCYTCEDRIFYYTCYSEDGDITFIMKDRLINNEPITSEVIGWYHGTPDKTYTKDIIADYLKGKNTLIAYLEPEEYKVKEANDL